MTKRMIIMLLIVALVLGAVFGFRAFSHYMMHKGMAAMGAPVQTITTLKAETQDWQPTTEAVGNVRAARGVDIASEISGIVEEIHFVSGTNVKAGTLLVKLRADDDIAKLHALEATAKLASITLERDKKQLKAQVISRAAVDNDVANLAAARAQASAQNAVVDKKFIRAPFSGTLGIRAVDLGQYLTPGTAIVTLQQVDPIFLDFYMPQQALGTIKMKDQITVKNDTYPDRKFTGQVSAINPKVDTATRNVAVRATLKNSDRALLPGMYATATINAGAGARYITLPQTAITYNPYGNTVFIVRDKAAFEKTKAEKAAAEAKESGDKGKPATDKAAEKPAEKPADKSKDDKSDQLVAEQAFVTIGATRGDQVAILKGVEEGDMVVTSGQMKLQNGSPVSIDNKISPTNDTAPEPKDR